MLQQVGRQSRRPNNAYCTHEFGSARLRPIKFLQIRRSRRKKKKKPRTCPRALYSFVFLDSDTWNSIPPTARVLQKYCIAIMKVHDGFLSGIRAALGSHLLVTGHHLSNCAQECSIGQRCRCGAALAVILSWFMDCKYRNQTLVLDSK